MIHDICLYNKENNISMWNSVLLIELKLFAMFGEMFPSFSIVMSAFTIINKHRRLKWKVASKTGLSEFNIDIAILLVFIVHLKCFLLSYASWIITTSKSEWFPQGQIGQFVSFNKVEFSNLVYKIASARKAMDV